MSVYTKKGDGGFTGLYGTKKRVPKSSKIIRALGALDETNSYLGTIYSKKLDLVPIQKNLMQISSIIAGVKEIFPKEETLKLEREIDKLEAKLPPLTKLVIPKGELMYARALVRRAEREVVGLNPQKTIISYVNRLSDFLFLVAKNEL